MPDSSAAPLRWNAFEHQHIERSRDWFWALGIIAVCCALTAVLFNDILFAVLILVAAGVISLIARTPPEEHEFEISERGIRAGNMLHRYEEVISFWVEEEGEEPTLLVDTIKFMAPNLIIPLDGVDPEQVRIFLRERVDEVPMREPLAHKVLEFFGF